MTIIDNCSLAFSIPEIQESIFRGGLSVHDLARASLVNRVWFQMVTPFLWENITKVVDFIPEWSHGFKSGIAAQGRWTRTLSTSSNFVLDWCSPYCTRLLSIHLGHLYVHRSGRNSLIKLLGQNAKLQNFRWDAEYSDNNQLFCDIASGLMTSDSKSLIKVELRKIQVDESLCKVLDHHFATMKYLNLSNCSVDSNTFCALKSLRSNLKSLVLDGNWYRNNYQLEFIVDQLSEFLETMTELVEFTFLTDYPKLIQAFPKALTRSYRSNGDDRTGTDDSALHFRSFGLLETLSLGSPGRKNLPEQLVKDVLDVLPDSLANLTLNGFSMGASGDLGITNFVQRNHDCLTSITFVDCQAIASESWQAIFTTCRHLKVLENLSRHSPLEVEIGMKKPWVCLGLERLGAVIVLGTRRLSTGGLDEENGRALKDELVLQDCRAFFSQLGVLSRLKKLSVIMSSTQDRRLGWSLKSTEVEKRILLMWSKLNRCKEMTNVSIHALLPEMKKIDVKMVKMGREMWGEEIKIRVML